MGSINSGNFLQLNRPPRRRTVETCLAVDAAGVGRLPRGPDRDDPRGFWRAARAGPGAEEVVARFRKDATGPYVRLDFRPPWQWEAGDGYLGAVVRLTRTVPARGGVRWWFLCPGPGCGKRVGKLYLPRGGTEWRCRACHALTYTSQQDSRRVDLLCAWAAKTLGLDGIALRECRRRRPPPTLAQLFPRPARPKRRARTRAG